MAAPPLELDDEVLEDELEDDELDDDELEEVFPLLELDEEEPEDDELEVAFPPLELDEEELEDAFPLLELDDEELLLELDEELPWLPPVIVSPVMVGRPLPFPQKPKADVPPLAPIAAL